MSCIGAYRDRTMQHQTLPADPLLTEQQAADLLDVKPTTLQVWRSTKRYALAHVKVGRNVRYRRSAVEAFIAARTVAA
jgi:excisionase family DNA binding protein